MSYSNNNNKKFIYPGKTQIDYTLTPEIRSEKNIIIKKNLVNPKIKNSKSLSYLNLQKHIFNYNFVKSTSMYRLILAGTAMAVLIAIVVVFSNAFCKANNITQFSEYDKFIWPVVMQDPSPFDENNPLTDDVILNASVWKAAAEKSNCENYYDSDGKVLVTLEDANFSCKTLFGSNVKLNLSNLGNKKTFYQFMPQENIFHVDCLSYDQCYVPNTVSLVELRGTIILKVNYITLDSFFNNNNAPEKCMEYHLKKQSFNNKFYICKISNC